MPRPLIIFGAGSLARLAHYYATHEMGVEVQAFVVDAPQKKEECLSDLPVITWEECVAIHRPEAVTMYVAIGYRKMLHRQSIYERVRLAGYMLQNIVSTSAFVADNVLIGTNNFLMPGVVIEPGVILGENNVFWSNSTICHDTVIANHNFIASNVTVGGEVKIGERNFVGFSSVIVQQCSVENDVLIGAQSLVLNDLASYGVYYGSPAKKVKSIDMASGVCVK